MSLTTSSSSMLVLTDQEATEALGRQIADTLHPGDVILLEGSLGAGKSTLVRALLRHMAGDPAMEVPSPTYTLVQGYDTPRGAVAHLDLWRLDGPDALHELGWDALLKDIIIVEWPDRLEDLRPPQALTIRLETVPDNDGARHAHLSGWPAERLPR
ncbi:tRNA (adenosine(37)-N6)-threonylcarbamoyltransferase complex ATPase subunit type 1 TsaE [Granulibacter bethesdensis]|uniref:tRNA (adenosine(37)-N6)-threonylcarbamoyltransferase complex ATPase subunit type 1 TsaE n=1 Tax=Granulibacter bethesdensis TaxID=364410 RepID=UPI0003F1EF1B|nr:tRNA (adenosine(37)-N6)-threonylcarbamoyltransferase complex ATPase subunit type 1 TsaE [Granulibacter bethesdensis]AHJ65524.1 ATP/GTP hydrolase [Granulibacter bethesdensis CGDNIH4]